MALPVLPPDVDFKKEYNFIWYLDIPYRIFEFVNSVDFENGGYAQYNMKEVMNSLFALEKRMRVSSLCSQVNLPDDEVELDMVPMGNVDYPVPVKVKRGDVTVTYLEDTLNTVYNFHKYWQSLVREQDSLFMSPLGKWYCQAFYLPFDNSITATEYGSIFENINRSGNSTLSVVSDVFESLDLHIKPTGIISYPSLFPSRISRTAANKQGTGLSTVTVTYTRIPLISRTKPLQKFDDKTGLVKVNSHQNPFQVFRDNVFIL